MWRSFIFWFQHARIKIWSRSKYNKSSETSLKVLLKKTVSRCLILRNTFQENGVNSVDDSFTWIRNFPNFSGWWLQLWNRVVTCTAKDFQIGSKNYYQSEIIVFSWLIIMKLEICCFCSDSLLNVNGKGFIFFAYKIKDNYLENWYLFYS